MALRICISCCADDTTHIAVLKRPFWQKSGSMCQKRFILSRKHRHLKILPPVYLDLLQAKIEANNTVGAVHAISAMRFAANQLNSSTSGRFAST